VRISVGAERQDDAEGQLATAIAAVMGAHATLMADA